MRLDSAHFEQNGVYLNTATYGLPPRAAWEAMTAALDDWRTGRTSELDWEADTERARATFARVVNVDPADVAVGATVSELLGLIAAALPDRTTVLTAEHEFTSALFPFAAQTHRGVRVRSVPRAHLLDAIRGDVGVVVASQVCARSGAVIDLDALCDATARTGALLCVDGTQACGWRPTDASRVDFYVCHAYKWLLAPRGAAFLAIQRKRLPSIVPLHAGWYATDDPNENLFGLPLRLSRDARRLDTSPAWFTWVGAARSLRLFEELSITDIERHDLALAHRFCAALDLPPTPSPIVYVEMENAYERLMRAGIRGSVRAGRLRLSFHLYNTEADVDAAVAAITT